MGVAVFFFPGGPMQVTMYYHSITADGPCLLAWPRSLSSWDLPTITLFANDAGGRDDSVLVGLLDYSFLAVPKRCLGIFSSSAI